MRIDETEDPAAQAARLYDESDAAALVRGCPDLDWLLGVAASALQADSSMGLFHNREDWAAFRSFVKCTQERRREHAKRH
jgi:hypothetical protein